MNSWSDAQGLLKAHGEMESVGVRQRLIERHKRIIEPNRDCFEGKSVLDLASHNGRWTYAAIKAGASYILGIESRQELIDTGLADFARFPRESYDFACGDVYDMVTIAKQYGRAQFDTILCLGLYYHISDHYLLFRKMRSLNPSTIIIDTPLVKSDVPLIRYGIEDSADKSNAISEHQDVAMAMRGIASQGFIMLAAQLSGYSVSYVPWKARDCEFPEPVADYFDSGNDVRRMTVVLRALPKKPKW